VKVSKHIHIAQHSVLLLPDNRQLMKWKAYMKSVTAKVSSRWTTGDKVSYQSADMMKYKEVSSKPEGSSQKQDSPGSDSQEVCRNQL